MNNGLTSYRFFAFFSVFLFHYGLFEFGYIGVHAFFVLSGFLLTPILLDMKANLSTKDYFTHFYGRRTLRIFPLYFLFLAILVSTAYICINYFNYDLNDRLNRTLQQAPYAATYTYNFLGMSSSYKLNENFSHLWSLAVEEQFYLIWPVILMLLPARKIKLFLLALVVLGPFIRAAIVWTTVQLPSTFNRYDITSYIFTFSSFDAFAIGGIFALYVKSVKWKLIFVSLVVIFLVGLITEYFSNGSIGFTSLGFQPYMADSFKYIWGFSLFSIIFGCLLVKIKNRECLPHFIEHKYFVYLGTISYGLYLYHFPILYFMKHELSFLPGPIKLMVIFSTSVLVSIISYELFEKPFLSKKDLWFKRS